MFTLQIMPSIPHDQRARVALFLEKQGFREQSLVVSTDPDHRFDLAINLGVSFFTLANLTYLGMSSSLFSLLSIDCALLLIRIAP